MQDVGGGGGRWMGEEETQRERYFADVVKGIDTSLTVMRISADDWRLFGTLVHGFLYVGWCVTMVGISILMTVGLKAHRDHRRSIRDEGKRGARHMNSSSQALRPANTDGTVSHHQNNRR